MSTSIDTELTSQLDVIFSSLDKKKVILPKRDALSTPLSLLAKKVQQKKGGPAVKKIITENEAMLFGTAAVEIWQRAVHSFLISASLTDSSPIWSSVSGYYSSHYSVRAIAHLLGFFHLHHRSKLVQLKIGKKTYSCEFTSPKGIDTREHGIYWSLVKKYQMFTSDPLFTDNQQDQNSEMSDQAHRAKVNYSDHVFSFPDFKPLDEKQLKERIQRISQITFRDTPHPRLSEFPDVDYVQVVAYHRLVRFRSMLDEALGGKNKFWNKHRNPPFAQGYVDFQITESFKFEELS